jgi:spore coat protein CotH
VANTSPLIRLFCPSVFFLIASLVSCRPQVSETELLASESSSSDAEKMWAETEQNVFNEPFIHQIYIKLNAGAWAKLHDDEKANNCKYNDNIKLVHVRHFSFDDQKFSDVAIKVKGNTSRCIPRPQFSVSLNKTEEVYTTENDKKWWKKEYSSADVARIKAQNLFGMTEFGLRRSFNDSSSGGKNKDSGQGLLMREPVGTWVMAQTEKLAKTTLRGAPVYRTAYAVVEFQLCANDDDNQCSTRFRRIYHVAENINKAFFAMRYGDRKPTAFGLDKGCGLKLDSSSQHQFSEVCDDPMFLEGQKYDSSPEMKSKMSALISGPNGLVASLQGAKTVADVEKILDLDSFLNYAAGATVIGHWDSALGNWNNDVIYFHAPTKKWKIITWDLDNTFDYNSPGGPKRSFSYKKSGSQRALFDTIFSIPEVETMLKNRISKLLSDLYTSGGSGALHDRMYFVQKKYIEKMNNDFKLHPDEKQNTSLSKEIFDYKRDRYNSLKEQLKDAGNP